MPRLPADFRIRLKRRGGKTHRIELVRNPFNQRFWVRRNGKHSTNPRSDGRRNHRSDPPLAGMFNLATKRATVLSCPAPLRPAACPPTQATRPATGSHGLAGTRGWGSWGLGRAGR